MTFRRLTSIYLTDLGEQGYYIGEARFGCTGSIAMCAVSFLDEETGLTCWISCLYFCVFSAILVL